MPPRAHRRTSTATSPAVPARCTTLLEDGMTRCSEPPTHGRQIERCRVHHKQYQTMTGRYKEAQKFVDETIAGATIPSKEDIQGYTSIATVLEKARLMKKYVNAIRVERTGRDIHHERFFLKVDDGHKMRIKTLAKRMTEGVEIRDALEARALALHVEVHPAKDWMYEFQGDSVKEEAANAGPDPIGSYMRQSENKWREQAAVNADDDLIALNRREVYLQPLALFFDPDRFWPDYLHFINQTKARTPEELKIRKILDNAFAQYFRRIVFHDPHLYAKALDKVSVKDFVLDDEFGYDNFMRVARMIGNRMAFGLHWWKDSLTEAIYIRDSAEASANMGSLDNRVKIMGGWVYNSSRKTPAPNKVWWAYEKDIENRYVRLCCNFDELHLFLTMSAFVLDQPSFCTTGSKEDPSWDSTATRKHLSLCGVILTDMVNGPKESRLGFPMPSLIPASQPGCVTWLQMESRTYIFGAIRNEPDDFTDAFLKELRARPDLFAVVTRSDTDPPRKVECFGTVTDQVRKRQFEAPPFPIQTSGKGKWEAIRSAMNVLYGGEGSLAGLAGRPTRSFFFHKQFPVKYLFILNASPTGNVHDLARQVAWAAFRAHGLVRGNYDEQKYDKASDVLFIKHARERLSFLPEGGYKVGNLASST
ncbi:hypothetical protein C8R47DRAFT_1173146 [Mycena vitilis]|nr:hypothetical protein C8R47DRAFT_1173146 [Mycena vitilis]